MPFIEESSPAPRPVMLLLCGYQHHGKSSVADWLAARHGFWRSSFADPIRAMLMGTGVPASAFAASRKHEPRDELAGLSAREGMERLGDWGREQSPEFWVRAWDRGLPDTAPLVVVDDARYDLEVAYAQGVARRRGAAFAVVHVDRSGHPRGTDHGSNRIPEVAVDVDFTRVSNFGAIDNAGRAVEALLRERGCV